MCCRRSFVFGRRVCLRLEPQRLTRRWRLSAVNRILCRETAGVLPAVFCVREAGVPAVGAAASNPVVGIIRRKPWMGYS